jgi:hypothetical protein
VNRHLVAALQSGWSQTSARHLQLDTRNIHF